ncbi:MAG: DUF2079 domain-containing protein [Spirochaetia bacterium]|nr:DUF2079 domain-containing protein [Spirochaetia bacterium]
MMWLGRFGILFSLFAGLISGAAMFLLYRFGGFITTGAEEQDRALFIIVLTAAVIPAVLNAYKDVMYHHHFITRAQETGVFANVIWRISHGLSQVNWMEATDHRGIHWQPALYFFALLYRAAPLPEMLLIMQAVAVYAAVVYLYFFTEKVLNNSRAAFFISLAFALSPYVTRILQSDFHLAPFYCVLFFAFFYYAESSMFLPAAGCFIAAVMLREEAPVFLGLASFFLWTRKRERVWFVLGAAGLIYGALAFLWFIPGYNARPQEILQLIGLNGAGLTADKLLQLLVMLSSVLFFAAVPSMAALLIALPPVAVFTFIHRGGSVDGIYLFHSYYSSFVIPAVFASTVYAAAKLTDSGLLNRTGAVNVSAAVLFMQLGVYCAFYQSRFAAAGVLLTAALPFVMKKIPFHWKAAALAAVSLAVYLPGYMAFYFGDFYGKHSMPAYAVTGVQKAISMLPSNKDIPVITNGNIIPHIAARKYVIDFDERPDMAALNPVLAGNFREFYVLGFMKFKKYIKKDPVESLDNIARAAQKAGYKSETLLDDTDAKVLLVRFYR